MQHATGGTVACAAVGLQYSARRYHWDLERHCVSVLVLLDSTRRCGRCTTVMSYVPVVSCMDGVLQMHQLESSNLVAVSDGVKG